MRSGSNPDDIQTAVVPSQPSIYPGPSSPSQGKAGPSVQPSALGSGNAKLGLGMMTGALVICVLGLGVIVWLQTTGNRGPATPPVPSSPLVQAASKEKPSAGPAQLPMTPDQPGQPLAAATPKVQLLVPAYFYPAGPGLQAWQHLMEAASKIKIVAKVNPSSGPGDQRNADGRYLYAEIRD